MWMCSTAGDRVTAVESLVKYGGPEVPEVVKFMSTRLSIFTSREVRRRPVYGRSVDI